MEEISVNGRPVFVWAIEHEHLALADLMIQAAESPADLLHETLVTLVKMGGSYWEPSILYLVDHGAEIWKLDKDDTQVPNPRLVKVALTITDCYPLFEDRHKKPLEELLVHSLILAIGQAMTPDEDLGGQEVWDRATLKSQQCLRRLVECILVQSSQQVASVFGDSPDTSTSDANRVCDILLYAARCDGGPGGLSPDLVHILAISTRELMFIFLIGTIEMGDCSMAAFLCQKGAGINFKDCRGITPIMHAVRVQAITAMILTLLELGADATAISDSNVTVLY